MKLPWKGSRTALVAAAFGSMDGEDRRLRFFICCIATLGTVAFNFLNPQIVRYTIDSVLGNLPLDAPAFVIALVERLGGVEFLAQNIWICALFILGAALLSAFCNMIRRYTGTEIGETVSFRLWNILYGHIQKLPYDWHVGCMTGDIIQRCTTDVNNIRNFIQNHLSELLRTACIFIVALAMMFSMDVFMSLVSLSIIPVMLGFSIFYFRRVSAEYAKADEAEGVMQAAAQENFTGVRVVRAFGRESYEIKKFAAITKTYQNIWNNIGKMLGFFWGAGDFLAGLQLVIVLGAGVWRSVNGQLSPGTFIAFYTYCNWMIWPVRQLGRVLSELSKTLVASGRIGEVLAVKPETDPPDALKPELKGEISFQNVTFAYGTEDKNSEPVLQNISFTLNPGQTLAILGETGSGKSSLVHLLCRLYDVKDGNGLITIDGIDIRRIERTHLRRSVGLCLQEPFLFSKTIKENITMAKGDLEMAEIQSAAAAAMLEETIRTFTDAYDTVVGERGVTLSGGQKQRLAVTRMLAGNDHAKMPIMIFDDSFSAVDTETETKIRAALNSRLKNTSVIIISHRITSLMQADKILVLDNGTIEDIGTHEELMERGGSYRRIYDLQNGVNNG